MAIAGLMSGVTRGVAAQPMPTAPAPPENGSSPALVLQQPAPGAFPVVLQGETANLEMGLAIGGDDPPFVRCFGACTTLVFPGNYWVTVRGPAVIEGRREVDIERPSTMLVHPRSQDARRSGLILGVLGIALIGAGGAAVLAAETGGDTSEGSVTLLGLGAVITGLVLTPIGWIKYGRSSPDVELLTER